MLFSVFRIGDPTNNVRWESYQKIAAHPMVKWAIPLSLGDSHRGFSVVGTNGAYFENFRYGGGDTLAFAAGKPFADLFEAGVGADGAERLGYPARANIHPSHGSRERG